MLWTLRAGGHVEVSRLGVMTVVGSGAGASRWRTRWALPWGKSHRFFDILGIFHPFNYLRARQHPYVSQTFSIFEKLLSGVQVITSGTLIEKCGMHLHSKWSPVSVVMVVEVSFENLVPDGGIGRWIACIHHRTAS